MHSRSRDADEALAPLVTPALASLGPNSQLQWQSADGKHYLLGRFRGAAAMLRVRWPRPDGEVVLHFYKERRTPWTCDAYARTADDEGWRAVTAAEFEVVLDDLPHAEWLPYGELHLQRVDHDRWHSEAGDIVRRRIPLRDRFRTELDPSTGALVSSRSWQRYVYDVEPSPGFRAEGLPEFRAYASLGAARRAVEDFIKSSPGMGADALLLQYIQNQPEPAPPTDGVGL